MAINIYLRLSEKGAVCVLSETLPEGVSGAAVSNARKALSMATVNFFGNPASKMKIIGVTGTNGKTSTTNIIKQIIEKTTWR